ncbi:MAG: SET domain-containing protein [Xanthobacteraceae bacterium]
MHYLADGLRVGEFRGKGGRGVFAARRFERGELLCAFGGIIMTTEELRRLTREEQFYGLQIENDLHLVTPRDSVAGADFINHSCAPNAELSGASNLVAQRRIEPGEEICFDYAMSDSHDLMCFDCECGAPNCRKLVSADDWRRPDLQRRYRNSFSPYLRRRIAAETSARRLAQAPHQRGAELHQDRGPLLD